jgi:glycosyltransferase involved in cell wall biosynthesis
VKITIINTSDCIGGAAIAARRLVLALRKFNIPATMLVREKGTRLDFVISTTNSPVKRWLNFYCFASERFLFFIREKSKSVRFLFSLANTGEDVSKHLSVTNADILHLHWINQGFLSLRSIKKISKLQKPVVWTLHDMWPFTGGCHHSGDCNRYKVSCGNCPFLKFPSENDLSNKVWRKKNITFGKISPAIVTCSEWLKNKAIESSLFSKFYISAIPNPINTEVFRPFSKSDMKEKFGFVEQRKYLLFSAVNVNNHFKGFSFFIDALNILFEKENPLRDALKIVILGRSSEQTLKQLPFNYIVMHNIENENEMCELYNAVDVYITSSLQENLPNTIMESFACGTPVVAFNIGGIPEMIEHKQNGYLAGYRSASDLANGLKWILYEADYNVLSMNARNKAVMCYSEKVVAEKYAALYNELLKKK